MGLQVLILGERGCSIVGELSGEPSESGKDSVGMTQHTDVK